MTLFTMPSPLRAVATGLAAALLAAVAVPAAAQSRGELLYTTHCIACHNTQVHWRNQKQAVDWPTLRAQVRAWQATAQLAWTDDDIQQVAAYLNEAHYHFPPPIKQSGAATGSARVARAAAVPTPGR
jgi:mono/diheme cytochrome c family protein